MPIAIYFEHELQSQNYTDRPIGSGAKGQVFRSVDGNYVFKRLSEQRMTAAEITAHRERLRLVCDQFNVVKQRPYWAELFAWPDRVALRMNQTPCLGVRMAHVDLSALHNHIEMFSAPTGYSDLTKDERGWWIAKVAICMKLARAVAYLDSFNLAHTDISGRNVYGDVFSGQMKLIDCDGIVSPGTELQAQVGGTIDFMAPELVSGDEPFPNLQTDRHALAVFIYRMLLYLHPLRGPRNFAGDGDAAEKRVRGRDALYIEHHTRPENRPEGRIFSTEALGARMHDLFQRAFVMGLHEPGIRPTAKEWEDALTRLYDRIVPCSNPKCHQRFFAAPESPGPLRCSWCMRETRGPASLLYMRLQRLESTYSTLFEKEERGFVDDDYMVVAWPGRTLHEWHLSTHVTPVPTSGRDDDPRPVASFQYDMDTNRWYLRNERATQLQFVGAKRPIPPGRTVPLHDGHQMYLGISSDSRLAIVEILRAPRGEVIYQLPDGAVGPDKPWPTLRPSQADKDWVIGKAISLQQYRFKGPKPPKQSRGRLLRPMLILAMLGALLGGGWSALLAFWSNPLHSGILLGLLLLGLGLRRLLGSQRMQYFWVVWFLGLVAPAVLVVTTSPLVTGIGALGGRF